MDGVDVSTDGTLAIEWTPQVMGCYEVYLDGIRAH